MTKSLKNISPKLFKEYLIYKGLKHVRTSGGHEIWVGKQLRRPIVIQTHINPIPEFIIRNNLRTLGVKADDFFNFLKSKK
jgi:hypothetical protein